MPISYHITAEQQLSQVLQLVPSGAVITLDTGLYTGQFTFTKPVTLQSASKGVVVLSSTTEVKITGNDVNLINLGFRCTDNNQQIINITGQRTLLQGCAILGDSLKGQHRGIAVNGQGTIIKDCYIDNCFLVGRDAQAICGWNGTKDVLIEDSYLAGGAQSIMLGGSDPSSVDKIPTNVTIRNCTLTKNPNWYAMGVTIKNSFELKNAINVTMEDCILEYAGISGGQSAYLIVLTPRNQNNTAPYSTVKNIVIRRCLGRFGGGGVNLMGSDDTNPSGLLTDVKISDVYFDKIDPLGITGGAGRGFLINRAPVNVAIEGITLNGQNLKAIGYFIGAGKPPPINFSMKNIKSVPTKYGYFLDNGGAGLKAVQTWATSATFNLTPTDIGASGYPTPIQAKPYAP